MLEKQLEDDQRLQAQLAVKAASDKQHLIDLMAQDQVTMATARFYAINKSSFRCTMTTTLKVSAATLNNSPRGRVAPKRQKTMERKLFDIQSSVQNVKDSRWQFHFVAQEVWGCEASLDLGGPGVTSVEEASPTVE